LFDDFQFNHNGCTILVIYIIIFPVFYLPTSAFVVELRLSTNMFIL